MTESNKNLFYRELGASILQARRNMGISQEVLGEKVGLSRASIVNIEKGRQAPPLHILWVLADILNTDISSFIPKIDLRENNELNPSLNEILFERGREKELNDKSIDQLRSFITKQLG